MFGLAWSMRCLARPQSPIEVSHPRMGSIPCAVARELGSFTINLVSVWPDQSMEKRDFPPVKYVSVVDGICPSKSI